ncbi:Nucleotidylyl transferase [Neolentinus lepideus HHB14362 ss-1]|uniref:choline-phosphate cytidylyltransferase n=1 Tax=Neolentinus lepideus HHB14362 ss-1 TaxID=1314782 RepID=A0A165UAK9_9AGAM|nr:Nucleotidylyl transferase [Neolentinus lepideus HHB14362 ss-1]
MTAATQTYATSVTSDDLDYDIISNGPRSLESSIDDLGHVDTHDIPEPPPTEAAREKLKTVSLTAEDIQAYVQRALGASPIGQQRGDVDRRMMRVYVDGVYDGFHAGHALQLRQAKLSFVSVYLIVGVFGDDLCRQYDYPVTLPHLERYEVLRHCRWVDEVSPEAPWVVTEEFLREQRIDYVALDEGTSIDPDVDRARLQGYDVLKSLGRIIPTRRTSGLTEAARFVPTAPARPSPVVSKTEIKEEDTIPEPIDIYGIGI